MTAADVLQRCRRYGVEVLRDGEQLRLRAPQKPPEEVLEAVHQHRDELLRFLSRQESRRDERAIVAFNLRESPDAWPVCIGAPGETVEDVIANLKGRYGDRVLEAREWTTARRTP